MEYSDRPSVIPLRVQTVGDGVVNANAASSGLINAVSADML